MEDSWEELALRDLSTRWPEPPERDDIVDWVAGMQELLADVEFGGQYVYFDGLFIPTDIEEVRFRGWHSEHDLNFVPHVTALKDDSVVETLLSNPEYWQSRHITFDEE